MIGRDEIDKMAKLLGVHSSHVQRDYVHGWLLARLYDQSALADRLVLKGGNCLRKCYFENSRYSRDLDFTTTHHISHEEIGRELNAIASSIEASAGVVFDTSRTKVEDKKRAVKEKEIAEARLFFKDFYGEESQIVLGMRLDITQFDRTHLPIQQRNLVHTYSDVAQCRAVIKCVKLEELLATKMRCLLQRKHIADLFDLIYATLIHPDISVDRGELMSTFFKITIFGSRPSVVKGLFLDLPLEAFGHAWETFITCPMSSWIDFQAARSKFVELIESLIPGHAESAFDHTFFASAVRNPILQAAESQTLLRLAYNGSERLVEPYELAFKRRQDGVAREYFYAYDTTGGISSGPGLKAFVPSNVQSVSLTERPFEPRFSIETNKSGGHESASDFGRGGQLHGGVRNRSTSPHRRTSSRRSSSCYGVEYQVQCPYCNKKFKRSKPDTKLNTHKDQFGNTCYGKTGYLV